MPKVNFANLYILGDVKLTDTLELTFNEFFERENKQFYEIHTSFNQMKPKKEFSSTSNCINYFAGRN